MVDGDASSFVFIRTRRPSEANGAFDHMANQIGNRRLLWHGSRLVGELGEIRFSLFCLASEYGLLEPGSLQFRMFGFWFYFLARSDEMLY